MQGLALKPQASGTAVMYGGGLGDTLPQLHNSTTAISRSQALSFSLFLFFCLALFTTKQKTSHAQNTGVFSIISKNRLRSYGSTLRSYRSIYFALTRCITPRKGQGRP